MATQQFELSALPRGPQGHAPRVRRARRYLEATHLSVGGLVDSFNVVHEKTVTSRANAGGRLRRDEVDLLRAALVFTSSGLDATLQTLVAECVPLLVERHGSNAAIKFDGFLDEEIRNASAEFRTAVKGPQPRSDLVRLYVEAKTKASYQGSGDVKDRVRDLLGIPNEAVPAFRIKALDKFFVARNDIVHQLDYVDPGTRSTKRHHRSPGEVVEECDRVLKLIADMIGATAEFLRIK